MTKFREQRGDHFVFDFDCEGCGAEGELKIPEDLLFKQVGCPVDCGALYILWTPGEGYSPELKCVVCPVFEDPDR